MFLGILPRPFMVGRPFVNCVLFRRSLCVRLAILVANRFISGLFVVFYRTFSLLLPFAPRDDASQGRRFRRSVIRCIVSLRVWVDHFKRWSRFLRFVAWIIRLVSGAEGAFFRFQGFLVSAILWDFRAIFKVPRACLFRDHVYVRIVRQGNVDVALTMRPSVPRRGQVCSFQMAFRMDVRVRGGAIIRHDLRARFVGAFDGAVMIFGNMDMNLRGVFIPIGLAKNVNDSLRRGVVIAISANGRTSSRFLYVRHVRRRRFLPFYRKNNKEGRRLRVVFVVFGFFRRHAPRYSVVVTFCVDGSAPTHLLQMRFVNDIRMEEDRIVS